MQIKPDTGVFTSITIERLCFYGMCLLSSLPLFFSHYPPMVDIPQHASQAATLHHLLFSANYPYRDLFQINWLIPYWGAYLPLLLLNCFLPMLLCVKLLLGAVIISTPIVVSRLRALFSEDPVLDWLALPISYGFAFQWGFLNFLTGVPVVLTFLLYAMRFASNPTFRQGIFLTLFTGFLLVMHLLIMGFGCGIAMIYLLAGNYSWKKKFFAIVPFMSGLAIGLIWLISTVTKGGMHAEPGPWDLSFMRPVELLASAIGQPFSYAAALLGLFIFVLPFISGFRITRNKPRIFMFSALLTWMLLGPNYFMGNYYTYNRFAIFMIPLFILLLTPPRNTFSQYRHIARALMFILPVALILGHCLRFATYELESKGYQAIYSQMQPQKRVAMLMFNPDSKAYHGPQFVHLPAWYQAEAGGIVDFSFALQGIQAGYKNPAAIPIQRGLDWYPEQFNWYRNKAWLYDYFVVRHPMNMGSILFASTNCPVKLLSHQDDWWLYGNDKTRCRGLK